jgi:hypothetical protein
MAGRFNLFSLEISSDFRPLEADPITEIIFDDLVYNAPEYEIMLEQVVEMDRMSRVTAWPPRVISLVRCHGMSPFRYHPRDQLASHLEQVRVHLRRRGEQVQKQNRAYGPREGEVAGWSAYAWGRSVGFSSLPLCASVHVEF